MKDGGFRHDVEARLNELEREYERLGDEIEERYDGIKLREKLRALIHEEIRGLRRILDDE